MCSTEGEAVSQVRLIGYDRLHQPGLRGVDAGYTADQYLDTPPGFAVYPGQ